MKQKSISLKDEPASEPLHISVNSGDLPARMSLCRTAGGAESPGHARNLISVAEVLVGLATDTPVYLSRRGGALKANNMTFTIRFRFLMAPWAPRAPSVPDCGRRRVSGTRQEPDLSLRVSGTRKTHRCPRSCTPGRHARLVNTRRISGSLLDTPGT